MLDVIALLSAPAPWEAHGAVKSLPTSFHHLLADWPGAPRDFFQTAGPVDQVLGANNFKAPRLVASDGVSPQSLPVRDLADLQEALTALAGQSRRAHLRISGDLAWEGTLSVRDVAGVTLDFSALRITPGQTDAPLISVTGSRKLTLCGLRLGRPHACAVALADCEDVMVCDSALSGATEAAIAVAADCRRVVIDSSAFARNPGTAVVLGRGASQTVVCRSTFAGPSRQPFLTLGQGKDTEAAVSAPACDIKVLDCRFGASERPAILAECCLGLWVERCDFAATTGGALCTTGPSLGLMVADNRIFGAAGGTAALVSLADAGLACLFRNTIEPSGQAAVLVSGSFGGLLVGANLILVPQTPGSLTPAAIRLAPEGQPNFLSTALMLNTIRGSFGSGIVIEEDLQRLFLFDNHIFGARDFSIDSRTRQSMVTSGNNWSPSPSLRVALSDTERGFARMVTGRSAAGLGPRALAKRLLGRG